MRLKRKSVPPLVRWMLSGALVIAIAALMHATRASLAVDGMHVSLEGDVTDDSGHVHIPVQEHASSVASRAEPTVRGVARGKVEIEGGLEAVAWDGSGVVKKVLVHDGDLVAEGTPVAELERQSERHAVEQAGAQLRLVRNAYALIAAQLPCAQTLERRLTQSAETGSVDAQRLNEARERLSVLTLRLAGAQAAIDVATQALVAARWEFDRRLLRAQGAGQIVGVHARVGQSVASSAPTLFLVMPDRPRYVRAEVNEYFIDAISPGMRTRISQDLTESSSEKSIEGNVLRVSPVYRTGVLDEPSEHGNARVVDVIVSLPASSDLKLGQPVKVKFYE